MADEKIKQLLKEVRQGKKVPNLSVQNVLPNFIEVEFGEKIRAITNPQERQQYRDSLTSYYASGAGRATIEAIISDMEYQYARALSILTGVTVPGGGGGGASFLKELTDVHHDDTGILRADGTAVQNGDILTYNSENGIWNAAANNTVEVTSHATTAAQSLIATIKVGGVSTGIYNDVRWGTYDSLTHTIPVTINGTTRILCVDGYSGGGSGGSNVAISNLLSSGTRVATITIDGTGYDILAPSGGSGGSTVSWGIQSGNTIPLSVDDVSKTLLLSDALSDYVTLSTIQTITGAKTFSTNPLTIASDSGISVNAASYIDIGEARLVYDSVSNALHVTKRTGGTVSPVGFYVDGFLSGGGIGSGSSDLDDMVTQNSAHPVKSSGIYSFVTSRRWVGTQAQYDALGTYDDNVEYLVTES